MSNSQTVKDPFPWEGLWGDGVAPGEYFDRMKPLPELERQVTEGLLPTNGRALIPGCGRGYDVELLARSGKYEKVIGADISETAVANAEKYLSKVDPPLPERSYSMIAGDFFADKQFDGPFCLVYDYTFLCAMPPAKRKEWADRMRMILQAGGVLVTAMFPMDKKLEEGGPPYGLEVRVYEELLDGNGFRKKDGPRKLDDNMTHEGRGGGRTWWCVWERLED